MLSGFEAPRIRGTVLLCHPGLMEASPTDCPGGQRKDGDLASWWPLLFPVGECEEAAAFVATLLHSAGIGVREVLELACTTGRHATHLSRHFTMTLVDHRPDLLTVSQQLNPGCRHLLGDPRSLRLDERFDAVLIHDPADGILTEDDLRAVTATAHAHCRPGGMAVFRPDHVHETFTAGSDGGGADADDGRGVRHHGWTWDPDPTDSWILTTRVFVLRQPDGTVELHQETRRLGLFTRGIWLDALTQAGFEASAIEEEDEEDTKAAQRPRLVFVGHRPPSVATELSWVTSQAALSPCGGRLPV